MRTLLSAFFSFIFLSLFAQTTLEKTTHDFGELSANADRYIDITFKTKSSKASYLLRIEQSPEVVYRINTDLIQPDSTYVLRFQVNPKQKGSFDYLVRIYFSDNPQAIELHLKGSIQSAPNLSDNYLTRCPDFSAVPSGPQSSELTIITVDKETGAPLSRSSVAIIRNGEPAGAWITGKKGSFKANIPFGFFYFLAAHDGYLKKEAGVYVGPEITEITIPLSKYPALQEPVAIVEPPIEEPTVLAPEEAVEIIKEQTPTADTVMQNYPELAKIPADDFSAELFNDVNVVFVLDISSSMKLGEKMDLMKYSLNQLVSHLRPSDRMGMVTYSDNAEVFQAPTLGSDKTQIQEAVSALKPKGMTAGGKGIKLGFKEVMRNFDPNKTNMVIVITDGAFNKDSDDYQKVVKKYAKKGIVFSVVGIQTKEKDAVMMTEAATFGHGRYVPIHVLADAQYNLLKEIRIASFKGK